MRRGLLTLGVLVALAVGCSVGDAGPSADTEVSPAPGAPLTRRALERALADFLEASGRNNTGEIWRLLSARTHERFGSVSAFSADELDAGLRAFARAGNYRVVVAEPVTLGWGVVAVARGDEAHALAFRLEERSWRVVLAAPLGLRPLAPDPGAVKGRHVQVAAEISAEEAPVGLGVLYLDGEVVPADDGGTDLVHVTVYGNVAEPLEPGRHTVVAFAQAGADAAAIAWVFRVET